MKIWSSSYQLYPIGTLALNQQSKFRKGTLLRIEFENGHVGFSDLCPYQQFGDKPLEIEIQNILRGQPTRLGARSLHFARVDANARARKESLYTESRIKNHFFISDFVNFDLNRVPILQGQRFTEFKVKIGSDLIIETEMLKALVEKLSADVKIRIDFNCKISGDKFANWLEKNILWLKPRLDFIEDPFSYDGREWQRLQNAFGVDLALDLAADPLKTKAEGANVVIIKPAIQDSGEILKAFSETNHRFVFTHYMDFPVGQMAAYVEAQSLMAIDGSRIAVCGLQHHDVYEGFTFQDAISNDGPFIVPPEGLGLGFDQLLERQDWTQIL
jgi:O-succinylbenzoate synthase